MILTSNLPSILGCLTICFSFLLEVIFLSFWFIFGVTIYLFSLTPHLIRQEIRLALALKYCVSSIPPSPLTLLWSELHPCSSRLLQVACPVSHFIIFNQGPSDPQVSKVLGALCPQGVIRAQCWTSREPGSLCNQVPRSLTFTQCLETGKHKVLHRVQMPTAFPVVTPRCLHLPSVTGPQRTVLNPPRGENLLTTPLAQFCRFPALTLLATYPEEWLLRCKSLGRNCPGGGGRCIRRKRETWSTSSRSSHQRSLKHNQFWTKQWKTFWKWQELWPQSRQEMASWTI